MEGMRLNDEEGETVTIVLVVVDLFVIIAH